MSVRAVSARGRLRRCWARKQGELSSRSSRPKLILGRHLLFGTLAVVTASRAVIAAPAQAARRLSWLAAGDSYSSGEGLPHATGHCAQARPGSGSEAWPFAAHDGLGKTQPALASPTFTACTRATTAQFFDSKKIKYYLKNVTLPAEWNPSMGRFDLVSFTFGGDDVRFADVIIQCVTKPALRLSCPGDALLRKRIAEFGRGYGAFLRKVANQAVVRGGNILVLGYPELIEKPSLWSARARVLGCGHLTPTDADELRGLAGDLNATLGANVAEVNRQHPKGVHLTFVDVTSGGSAGISPVDPNLFEPATGSRHEVCSSKPWINPLSAIDRKNGSYHPKQAGQNAMGALAAQVIGGLYWPGTCPGSFVVLPGVGDATISDVRVTRVSCPLARAAIESYEGSAHRHPFTINGEQFQCAQRLAGPPGWGLWDVSCRAADGQTVGWRASFQI
jgi:hypothetical protein